MGVRVAKRAGPAMLAGMFWLPESPRWLLLSGAGPAAATTALRRAKGGVANETAVQVGGAGGQSRP